MEDVGNRIASSVAIPGTDSEGGVMTKAIEDLAAACHGRGVRCGGGATRRYV